KSLVGIPSNLANSLRFLIFPKLIPLCISYRLIACGYSLRIEQSYAKAAHHFEKVMQKQQILPPF
ncbi:hypothetical protein, partial [Listeria fleischmannii]|uniref:hypothetical protein n=1 Tax=Listeria fleischmannii TaxID=1069827 RepID=UPI001C25A4E6